MKKSNDEKWSLEPYDYDIDTDAGFDTVWSNARNFEFYNSVTTNELITLAKIGGLDTGCDIKAVRQYWQDAHSILDVGAGYGRVINTILREGQDCKITAIEQSTNLVDHLQQTVGQRANIIKGQITDLQLLHEYYDVIFFMWSGLADFCSQEQASVINLLASRLQPHGVLIFDSMPADMAPLGSTKIAKQSYYIHQHDQVVFMYLPTWDEVVGYIEFAQLELLELKRVTTTTGRSREIYIAKKP